MNSKLDHEDKERKKERKLVEKIEESKRKLAHLQEKRKMEIGKLAYQYGLHKFSNDELETAFKELMAENSG